MKCNFCRSDKSEIIAKYARFEKINVLKCTNCDLVYLELKQEKEALEGFYTSEYRKMNTLPIMSPEEHFNDEVTIHDTEERINFVTSNLNCAGKRILEIGSASGSLLEKLSDSGCLEVSGIELGEEYANYARGLGFQVFSSSLEELRIEEAYDAIISFHTIEHVFSPMAVIKAVFYALKPGGIFLGEVPNQYDWRIKIFDDEIIKRFHYDPVHYYYFTDATFRNYLEKCGFTDIKFETVERYNSLIQLTNIICLKNEGDIEEVLRRYISPSKKDDEVRLPDLNNQSELLFNRIFAKGVNSELMGNCLRWKARKVL